MKVKLQTDVCIPTPIEQLTCKGCVFLSDNGAICQAPDSIYESCGNLCQVFYRSQQFFKIFDL